MILKFRTTHKDGWRFLAADDVEFFGAVIRRSGLDEHADYVLQTIHGPAYPDGDLDDCTLLVPDVDEIYRPRVRDEDMPYRVQAAKVTHGDDVTLVVSTEMFYLLSDSGKTIEAINGRPEPVERVVVRR
jgi:hypothetical protein